MRASSNPRWTVAPAALLWLVATACTGKLVENPRSPSGGSGPSGPASGDDPVGFPAPADLGPPTVRRLSNAEYENTVADLLAPNVQVTAGFLPDDRTLGYKNIAQALTVTPVLAEQYARAARTLASTVSPEALAPCASGTDQARCATAFIRDFGRRAYRRPLGSDEIEAFQRLFEAERMRSGYPAGVRVVVETMLQSPHFLYKTELGRSPDPRRELTPHEVATHLSYLVTGSMPDPELAAAADAGALSTAAQREAQVKRLLATERATRWIGSFITHWLGFADVRSVQKDPHQFPDYETRLQPAIVEASERFVDAILRDHGGSLRTLFLADWSYVDGRLAELYGLARAPEGWQQALLPPDQRLGILTHPAFLAAHAKANDSFPIGRGKILRTRVLCQEMPPPPPDAVGAGVEPNPEMTTRERFARHAESGSVCASCHRLIDPLGFGFENYDAVGAYRVVENGKPIDSSGAIVSVDPEIDGPFVGAVDFVKRVEPSRVLRDCAAREAFRWGMGREEATSPPASTRDAAILEMMALRLATRDADLRELLVGLVRTRAYAFRAEP